MEEQLAVLRRRVQLFTSCGGCAEASAAARRVLQLLQQQQQRESGHVYVHLDMDMFFCAVEMRDDPSLRSQPMAVGSLSMLSTANYAARRFGVRSGMPGFIAKQLCPSLAIVRPNFRKYRATGETIRYVLQAYDPSLSLHSLDEASLDVTDCLKCATPCPPNLCLLTFAFSSLGFRSSRRLLICFLVLRLLHLYLLPLSPLYLWLCPCGSLASHRFGLDTRRCACYGGFCALMLFRLVPAVPLYDVAADCIPS